MAAHFDGSEIAVALRTPTDPRISHHRSKGASPPLKANHEAPKFGGGHKQALAVLPLSNMSGETEQEFFADGLTEDISTELSRFRDLVVISRSSVFVHKGKAVSVQEIAKEFGVDYVVEGECSQSR